MADFVPDGVRLADVHSPLRLTLPSGVTGAAGSAWYEDSNGKAQLTVSVPMGATGVMGSFDGISVKAVVGVGDPVTLFQQGSLIYLGCTGTIGGFLYPSDNAGQLSDVAVTTDEMPVAKNVALKVISVVRMDRP